MVMKATSEGRVRPREHRKGQRWQRPRAERVAGPLDRFGEEIRAGNVLEQST